MNPQAAAFANYFRTWGMALPDSVVEARADGHMSASGWSVRWRWLADGSLVFRADHRMTDERIEVVTPDGAIRSAEPPVPFSMMLVPEDRAERERAEAEYRASWTAHGERVRREGLVFAKGWPQGLWAPDAVLWRTDDGEWQVAPRSVTEE